VVGHAGHGSDVACLTRYELNRFQRNSTRKPLFFAVSLRNALIGKAFDRRALGADQALAIGWRPDSGGVLLRSLGPEWRVSLVARPLLSRSQSGHGRQCRNVDQQLRQPRARSVVSVSRCTQPCELFGSWGAWHSNMKAGDLWIICCVGLRRPCHRPDASIGLQLFLEDLLRQLSILRDRTRHSGRSSRPAVEADAIPSDGQSETCDGCRTRDLALGPSRFPIGRSQRLGLPTTMSHEGDALAISLLACRGRFRAFYPEAGGGEFEGHDSTNHSWTYAAPLLPFADRPA